MSREDDDEEVDRGPPLGNLFPYLPTMVRERWTLIAGPAIFFLCVGIAAAFLLPETYRSSATLLVESPELPDDVLGAENDFVDRRIEIFRRQILSPPRLAELVQKHRLYAHEKPDGSLTDDVATMSEAIRIDVVSASTQGSGFGRSSTVAIELAYESSQPDKAQAGAQAITEELLSFYSTQKSEQADTTVQFLSDQASAIRSQIDEVEAEIRDIKAANGLSLSNPGMLGMSNSGGSYDVQIIALQRDNALLRAQRAAEQTSAERDPIVSAAEADLAAAQAKYTDNHPDIALAKRRLREARQLAASNQERLPDDTIDQQIAANNAQIETLRSMKAQENARMARAQNAMARSPLIQEQIAQREQRLEIFNRQYEALTERLRQAQASSKAESERKGERLTLITPPNLPQSPISPNRLILIAGGLAGGVGLGLFLVLAIELFFRPIRNPDDILAITGEAALASIPTIEGEAEEEGTSWLSRLSFARATRRTLSI